MPVTSDKAQTLALRELSLTAVLDALQASPRASRAELAAETGLSKPTVGAALSALHEGGLVRERGRTTGRRGPSASLYEFVPEAATILAIDVGTRRVLAVQATLDAKTIREVEQPLTRPTTAQLLDAIREIRNGLVEPATELAIVGSPGIVDPRTGRIRSSPHIDGWEGIAAESTISTVLGIPTVVENDVNLAALGELAKGAGRGRRSFAYLNIGSGLGAGLVFEGQLYRGRHGAAGEVGYLATNSPHTEAPTLSRGAMEMRLSAEGLLRFAKQHDSRAPDDLRQLFADARAGDPLGRAVVAEAVTALATCIASINAVTDLELVLLGGGVGAQTELLLEPVRDAVADLVPYAPEILPGELGAAATLTGALATGVDHARSLLIKRCLQVPRDTETGSPIAS